MNMIRGSRVQTNPVSRVQTIRISRVQTNPRPYCNPYHCHVSRAIKSLTSPAIQGWPHLMPQCGIWHLSPRISCFMGEDQTSRVIWKRINSCVIPNSLEFLEVFVPERSGTLFAMCTGYSTGHSTGHLSNSVCYLHRNHPELHRPSEPQPSGTFRNLMHQNSSEACLLSAIMPSNFPPTLLAICTGTLRKFISHLHQNPPQPCLLSAP